MGTTSLGELFDRNPSDLTDEERDKILLALRERREVYLRDKVEAQAKGRRKSPSIASPSKISQIMVEVGELKFD